MRSLSKGVESPDVLVQVDLDTPSLWMQTVRRAGMDDCLVCVWRSGVNGGNESSGMLDPHSNRVRSCNEVMEVGIPPAALCGVLANEALKMPLYHYGSAQIK